ncbi:MAG: hypothetical protein ACI4UO_03270, partial [Paludibacteraceae bacterium]
MLALFATLCVGTAYAEDPEEGTLQPISITLNVDDPDAVDVYANGSWTPMTLNAGNNVINITPEEEWDGSMYYPEVSVEVNEGYGIEGIVASATGVPGFYLQYAGVYMLYPTELCNGVTYTVSTYAYADMRTDSVIVLIDDETKATMAYGNGQSIVLDSTVNVVYFSSDAAVADLPLIVRTARWDSYLYKVTLNDSVIVDYGRGYQMYDVENGDTIQILANAPAGLTFPVIFNWAEGADKAALDSVQIDGVTVEYKDTIEVAWGKVVKLWLNTTEYLVKIDNSKISSSYYSETILDTVVWDITCEKFESFDVKIIAHNPGCFTVQKSIDYSYATLVEGENTISLNSSNSYIYIRNTDDCVIDSVTVNGVLQANYSSIECEKNMTIEIWGDSIRRDQTFALYVDTVANYNYTIRTSAYKYFAYYYSGPYLTDGYSTFAFADADNPIGVSVGWGKNAVCYLNDSIVELSWGSCTLKLANNDVVKIFADTAEVYTVGIYVAGDAVVENATKDRIVAITDLKKNFDVLQGTEVSFETEATVHVNGVVAEGVDGVYTLVINENTTIVIGELTSCAEANVAAANTVLAMDEFVVAYVN